MDYHKPPLSPWGHPHIPSSSNHPGILPDTVLDPFTRVSYILRWTTTNHLFGPWRMPSTHPGPHNNCLRHPNPSKPRGYTHQPTIPLPPSQPGINPGTVRNMLNNSFWTISIPLPAQRDTYQPTHPLLNPV